VEPAQIEEMLDVIKFSEKPTLQPLQALQTETTQMRLSPFGGGVEETVDDLEAFLNEAELRIRNLKSEGLQQALEFEELEKSENIPISQNILQNLPRQQTSPGTPELSPLTILNTLQQEQEKKKISGVVGDIRNIIEPELELDEKVRKRGFITGVEKRALGVQRSAEEFSTRIQERSKDKLTEFVTRERSLFGRKFSLGESAEEFIKRREEAREEAIEKINNKYVININNPVVRTDEDIQRMKRDLRSALSGL
jgi:hypothetical protein